MENRILITGAFNDASYKFTFFEQIASALEGKGSRVYRFNAFGFSDSRIGKMFERLITGPGRLIGLKKQRIREALPWTPDSRREAALLAAVREFRPHTMIVISGFRHRPKTLQRCRELGVKRLVGWYVEGPTEPG